MHQSSFDKMCSFRDRYLAARKHEPLVILDLGSQDVNGSYRPLFDEGSWKYLGADMSSGANVDIVLADPYCWSEVKPGSVDVLISGQAFEHIEYFWITMQEISRVLKQAGLCCLIAPSGGPEHRYPVDCWRFYPDGFAAAARFGGIEVVEVFTDWAPGDTYTDESALWKDTMLVGRKPRQTWFARRKASVRRWMMCKAAAWND